ncbi:MAG: hypothetical protein JXR37_04255 [Kiritimatiellae bacterium]|nr:hypothetical protein [Kiritimatiellia bacterium]
MAEVDIERILDYMSFPGRKALAEALRKVAPDTTADIDELYRQFLNALRLKCGRREYVPDTCVVVEMEEANQGRG